MTLPWPSVHLIAAREAARAHRGLGIDTSRRIDPFAALAASGVPVLRRRLDGMAGVYLPGDPQEGSSPGVIVNVAHPPSRQRFTAAHELAHHRRDGRVVFDRETEWLARGETGGSDSERIAEAFAAWFLMPKKLVVGTIEALGLAPPRLDAAGAYALALELGTSYAATVRHLSDMRLIGAARRDQLLRVAPATIKREIGALDAAADTRRDVWLVRPSRPATAIGATEGDAVVVEMPEATSGGYLWEVTAAAGLSLIRDEYRLPDGDDFGGLVPHRFLFRVDAAGREALQFAMRQPWDPASTAGTFRVDIAAEPPPVEGLVEPELLLAAAS
jgi:Zn-dependent peptidase ImmA (M78 family)